MFKIYRYEIIRLLFNKFFVCLLLITALFSKAIITGEIILGIANTAPFSGWSYGVYLAKVLPILSVSLLFFVSFLYTKKEKQVKILFDAASMKPETYRMIKTAAIVSAYGLVVLVPISYSIGFYTINFHCLLISEMSMAIVYTIIPSFLFILGLGLLLGRLHAGLIYALMAVVLLFPYLPFAFDLYGNVFLAGYPQTLDVLDPLFLIPTTQLIKRGLLCISEIALALTASKIKIGNHR